MVGKEASGYLHLSCLIHFTRRFRRREMGRMSFYSFLVGHEYDAASRLSYARRPFRHGHIGIPIEARAAGLFREGERSGERLGSDLWLRQRRSIT